MMSPSSAFTFRTSFTLGTNDIETSNPKIRMTISSGEDSAYDGDSENDSTDRSSDGEDSDYGGDICSLLEYYNYDRDICSLPNNSDYDSAEDSDYIFEEEESESESDSAEESSASDDLEDSDHNLEYSNSSVYSDSGYHLPPKACYPRKEDNQALPIWETSCMELREGYITIRFLGSLNESAEQPIARLYPRAEFHSSTTAAVVPTWGIVSSSSHPWDWSGTQQRYHHHMTTPPPFSGTLDESENAREWWRLGGDVLLLDAPKEEDDWAVGFREFWEGVRS